MTDGFEDFPSMHILNFHPDFRRMESGTSAPRVSVASKVYNACILDHKPSPVEKFGTVNPKWKCTFLLLMLLLIYKQLVNYLNESDLTSSSNIKYLTSMHSSGMRTAR